MGWLNKIPPNHDCDLPEVDEADAGSTWQCDDCGKVYRLLKDRFYCKEWDAIL